MRDEKFTVWYCPTQNNIIVLDEYDHFLIKRNNWMCWFYVGKL